MSHRPVECEHNYLAWTTEQTVNEAGESVFVFQRKCSLCAHVDVERGAIIEAPERAPWLYTKIAGEEPSD